MDGIEKPELTIKLREIRPKVSWIQKTKNLHIHKIWEGWRSSLDPERKSYLEIEVRDNGEGIPQKEP